MTEPSKAPCLCSPIVDSTCTSFQFVYYLSDAHYTTYSIATIDYQARHHEVDFVFSPYYGAGNLSFTDVQKTFKLKYKKTILHWDRDEVKTSGLDPLAVRPAQKGYPQKIFLDPEMPIANASYQHLSVGAEAIVENDDGT